LARIGNKIKIAFMGEGIAQWLAADFAVLGVQFQNWMPIAVAIVAGFVLMFARSQSR
jgi:hypothetical protein